MTQRSRRRLPPCVVLLALLTGACVDPVALREAQLATDTEACLAEGFEPDSEAFALCRLLQHTNRRIDGLSQRLRFIESDLQLLDLRLYDRRYRYR